MRISKQKLKQIIKEELQEVIGLDVKAVKVPASQASKLRDAHAFMVDAMALIEEAKDESTSDDLKSEIQKAQDSLSTGAATAIIMLADLIGMEVGELA
jgi:hypothetical protein